MRPINISLGKNFAGNKRLVIFVVALLLGVCAAGALITNADNADQFVPLPQAAPAAIPTNPVFKDSVGDDQRCTTCHEPGNAWSAAPKHFQTHFAAIFGRNRISPCPFQSQIQHGIDGQPQSQTFLEEVLEKASQVREFFSGISRMRP